MSPRAAQAVVRSKCFSGYLFVGSEHRAVSSRRQVRRRSSFRTSDGQIDLVDAWLPKWRMVKQTMQGGVGGQARTGVS